MKPKFQFSILLTGVLLLGSSLAYSKDEAPKKEWSVNDPKNWGKPYKLKVQPRGRYPYAKKTKRPGYVISPHTGNIVDVRGIPKDAQVRDPAGHGLMFTNP